MTAEPLKSPPRPIYAANFAQDLHMPFMPGDPKPPGSGRRAGQVSKKTALVRDLVEAIGVCPVTILAHIASGNTVSLGLQTAEERAAPFGAVTALEMIDVGVRARAASDLAGFLYPKLGAVRVQTVPETPEGTGVLLIPATMTPEQWLAANKDSDQKLRDAVDAEFSSAEEVKP